MSETYPITEQNLGYPLWIPEQLVDVVVPNDLIVVLFFPNELAIDDFVSLVTYETIQGFNHGLEIESFRNGIHSILTLGTPIVVVRALENEAQTFRRETNIPGFAPAQQIESDLPKSVVVTHVVHSIPPSIQSTVKRFDTTALGPFYAFESLEAGILGLSDGVVKVKLGGEIPFAIVGMLPTNVVSVKGEKRLIRRHAGCT